jgi:antirestriction protein ArdC
MLIHVYKLKSNIMAQTDIYQQITNQLIEILETHKNLDYTCNWTPSEVMTKNVVTGRNYKGFNQLYLSFVASQHYYYNRWITFLQGRNLKAKVKKGEHSRIVTFWKRNYYSNQSGKDVTKKVEKIIHAKGVIPENITVKFFLRYYRVFNIEQFENLPVKYYESTYNYLFSEDEKDEKAEDFIHQTRAEIEYKHGNSCYYIPAKDKIVLCKPEQFKGKEAYYSVLFHELGHWTGHESRMNRDLINRFGTAEYAFEELVAEFFSAFTSAHNGFTSKITNNAAYIDSWLSALEDDVKFAIMAASKAQKALNYVNELVSQESTEISSK